MISGADVYHVIAATVPLYAAMILAYASMKYWKLFTPEQCAGINKFVAKFSIPLLSFQVISANNPYKMNIKLVLADLMQKVLAILVLAGILKFRKRGGLNWVITGLSLSTLPNTLILGIPLLRAMYGDEAGGLLAQIVVLQSIIWYNLLLYLFELGAMKKEAPVTPSPDAAGEMEISQEERPKDVAGTERPRSGRKYQTLLVLLKVGRKLLRNPNTHATWLGLTWASIHFRWNIKLPGIIDDSILILSQGGLGMAMFSLGLFMASQVSIIPCGARMTFVALALKFLAGPAIMAAPAFAIRLKGTLFKVAIVQAALPQGIVPFVFAKEYNVHPNILSTGVIFGFLIALPVALSYYLLLAL